MNVLVSGLLNIETTVSVRSFPINYYPIDYPFFGVNSDVSGVGFNLAGAFSKLGDKTDLISFVGNDDEAERIFRHLDSIGVSHDGVKQTLKSTPASAILFDPDGKRQIYCDLKDIQEQKADPSDPIVKKLLSNCDVLCACNINFNRTLLSEAKKHNKIIATDVHVLGCIDDEYNRDFMEASDILFLSDEKLPCPPEEFISQLLQKFGCSIIVIGMGKNGAMLADMNNKMICHLDAVRNRNVVNTVGAGDALFSSFIHFYFKGYEPLEALKRAELFAAIKIGSNGASKGFVSETVLETEFKSTIIPHTILNNG